MGIIDARFRPESPDGTVGAEVGGVVLYWHVDDVDQVLAHVVAAGARVQEHPQDRGEGFITATVIDPFGTSSG